MSHSAYDAVIFDFDGTLVDTADQIIHTAKVVLADHGLKPARYCQLVDLIGPPFPQAFSQVFGYSSEEAAQITTEYRARYAKLGISAWPLFEGVEPMLRELVAHQVLLGIASSKRDHLLHVALKQHGVEELFSCVRGKLDDSVEAKALTLDYVISELKRRLPSDPRLVMVGDRFYDIEAAHACKIDSVGVYYGKTAKPGELEQAGATHVVKTVAELKDVLISG